MSDTFNVTVKICNITLSQSIALEDLFATWQGLGGNGSSRWTSFYADGDGNFHPKIFYNGNKPRNTKLMDIDSKWRGSEYRMDFDSIGWRLRNNPETQKEINYLKMNPFKILYRTIRNWVIDYKAKIARRKRWKQAEQAQEKNQTTNMCETCQNTCEKKDSPNAEKT